MHGFFLPLDPCMINLRPVKRCVTWSSLQCICWPKTFKQLEKGTNKSAIAYSFNIFSDIFKLCISSYNQLWINDRIFTAICVHHSNAKWTHVRFFAKDAVSIWSGQTTNKNDSLCVDMKWAWSQFIIIRQTRHIHQIVVVIYSIKHITTRMYSKIRLWCKKKIYIHHIKNKYNATYENASDLLVYAVFTYSKSGFVR